MSYFSNTQPVKFGEPGWDHWRLAGWLCDHCSGGCNPSSVLLEEKEDREKARKRQTYESCTINCNVVIKFVKKNLKRRIYTIACFMFIKMLKFSQNN